MTTRRKHLKHLKHLKHRKLGKSRKSGKHSRKRLKAKTLRRKKHLTRNREGGLGLSTFFGPQSKPTTFVDIPFPTRTRIQDPEFNKQAQDNRNYHAPHSSSPIRSRDPATGHAIVGDRIDIEKMTPEQALRGAFDRR